MNTVAADLLWIRTHHPRLWDMLNTRHGGAAWPPSGSIIEQMNRDNAEPAQRPARDGTGAGERPAPLRVEILDVAIALERDLLELCDRAATLEPPTVPQPERWQYATYRDLGPGNATHLGSRAYGVGWACIWLTGALETWLPASWAYRVASTVRACRRQLDTALDQARQTRRLAQPCPHCRGALDLHGGDGAQPAVVCRACQRTWRMTEPDPAAA